MATGSTLCERPIDFQKKVKNITRMAQTNVLHADSTYGAYGLIHSHSMATEHVMHEQSEVKRTFALLIIM